jgi:hypothetical protein
VRPDDKSVADIEHDGPQITQAGLTNHRSTTVRRFYAHPVAPNRKN